MSDLSQADVLTLFVQAMPYPEHVADIDLSDPTAVRLTWRRESWRIEVPGLDVMRREDGGLIGDNASILIRTLLKRQRTDNAVAAFREERAKKAAGR